jgi:hypothetical protein
MRITAESTQEKTQYANKVVTVERLKLFLMEAPSLDSDNTNVIEGGPDSERQ